MHAIEELIILDKESPLILKRSKLTVSLENELDEYILSCSRALTSLSSSMDKARLSLSLLDIKHLESISSDEHPKSLYIELIIENSIIRVQSIYDRALILTNKLLDLGVSNDSINHNLIVTNEKVQKYGLHSKLRAIHKACNQYRLIRNTVIHHDRFTEDEFNQLSLVINADHMSRKLNRGEFIDRATLDELTQTYLDIKREDLSEYLDAIESRLGDYFDTAAPIYGIYKDKMRSTITPQA